jgi:hypothetical protein
MKRHKDALGIQQGARNVRAIARSLVAASDEAVREGIGAEQDAAVRMIVHQLARVCNVDEINYGFDPASLKDVYCLLMAECEERAKEIAIRPSPQACPDAMEPIQLPAVASAPKGPENVEVVLHEAGEALRTAEPDSGEGSDFSEDDEPRRGFFSRILFKGGS